MVDSFIDGRAHTRLVYHIQRHVSGGTARCDSFPDGLQSPLAGPARDNNLGTFGSELNRHGPAESVRRPGDNDNLAVQATTRIHVLP